MAGKSGVAYIDAMARELIATAYLHNHTRMWWASFWIDCSQNVTGAKTFALLFQSLASRAAVFNLSNSALAYSLACITPFAITRLTMTPRTKSAKSVSMA